jgi:hypothetical protein
MMATTLKKTEFAPESYPDLGSPSPLSAEAASIDPAIVWQRLEAYVAFRWSEREVVWIVEGPGDWAPPLAPAVIDTAEIWSGGEWVETFDYGPSPCGLFFPAVGPYRVTAIVGGGSPLPSIPETVVEAYARLAEYMARNLGIAGASRVLAQGGDGVAKAFSRSPAWRASALQNSGAADLLRQFRRC